MTKKTVLILVLFLASAIVKADINENIVRITKDGYLLNPITSTPIKTKTSVLDRKIVNKIKLTKKESYFNEIFDLSQVAIYAPNEESLESDKALNGTVLFIFKGWVGEDLKVWTRAAVPFKNNKPDEKVFTYFPSGNIEIEINYLNGKRDGVMKTQDNDGDVIREITYDKGSVLSRVKYYKSGVTSEYLSFSNNGKISAIKIFAKDGSIKYEKNYEVTRIK